MSPEPTSSPTDAESSPASDTLLNANSFLAVRPFFVLGVESNADAEVVRARYLELIRQYPPDRDPVMFAKIRYAYEAASNPIVFAQRLIESSRAEPRPWNEILDENASMPPRLSPELLLSLGNRRQVTRPDSETQSTGEAES